MNQMLLNSFSLNGIGMLQHFAVTELTCLCQCYWHGLLIIVVDFVFNTLTFLSVHCDTVTVNS